MREVEIVKGETTIIAKVDSNDNVQTYRVLVGCEAIFEEFDITSQLSVQAQKEITEIIENYLSENDENEVDSMLLAKESKLGA